LTYNRGSVGEIQREGDPEGELSCGRRRRRLGFKGGNSQRGRRKTGLKDWMGGRTGRGGGSIQI